MPNPVTINSSEARSWSDWITNFDATAAEFMTNYDALLAIGPDVQANFGSDPKMIAAYDDLVTRATDSYNTLLSLQQTREAAASWLTYLQSGAQGAFDWFVRQFSSSEPGTLQAIPAIAFTLAAAAAAIYSISLVIDDMQAFAERYNFIKAREAAGDTTDQAIYTANQMLGPVGGGSTLLGIPTNVLLFAAVAIFLGPPLLAALTSRVR